MSPQAETTEKSADQLHHDLQLDIEVDVTDQLANDIEIRIVLDPHRRLQPLSVRLSPTLPPDRLVAARGVKVLCHRYNEAFVEVRALQNRLAAHMERGQMPRIPQCATRVTGTAMNTLEADLLTRQMALIKPGVVTLRMLEEEVGFLDDYRQSLKDVTTSAASIVRVVPANSDTLDEDLNDE